MHNLKEIRKDFDAFIESLKSRFIDIEFDKIKDLDIENRKLIQKKEALESEKKDISKSKDKSLFNKSKEISSDINKISQEQQKIKTNLDKILSNLPNIPHKDVPNGKDENDNVEISKSGKIPKFDLQNFSKYLTKIGYRINYSKSFQLKQLTKAFQMRFRPELIDGKLDLECYKIAKSLNNLRK